MKTILIRIYKLIRRLPLEIIVWLCFVVYALSKSTCYISQYDCYSHVSVITKLIFTTDHWISASLSLLFDFMFPFLVVGLFVFCRREILASWKKWGIVKKLLTLELYIILMSLYLLELLMLFKGNGDWCVFDNCGSFAGAFIEIVFILFVITFHNKIGFLVFGLPAIFILIISMIYKFRNNNFT